MDITNIDLELVEMVSNKLGMSLEEVINLAVNELALKVMSEDTLEEIQKEYKAIIADIRNSMFKVYRELNAKKITSEEANEKLEEASKLLKSFMELSKVDGNITGFLVDYKAKLELLQREKEYMLKRKGTEINAMLAEHNVRTSLIKLEGGLR